MRSWLQWLLVLLALAGPFHGLASGAAAQEARCFPETDFCIRDARILDFFQRHGRELVFGYPVSRLFQLRGETVQLFQRVGVRIGQDGQVSVLNLLDDDLLPLTRIGGLTLPSVDPGLVIEPPPAGSPDYERRLGELLASLIPDTYQDLPVGFGRAYLAAAGSADGPPSAALAVYGWPTSGPRAAPENPSIIFQRFERAVFQYNAASGETQALLLGDYAKTVLTGRGLPAELEADLADSPLLRQYNPAAPDGLHRPWELPGSNLSDAFRGESMPPTAPLFPPGFGQGTGWPTGSALLDAAVGVDGGDYQVSVEQAGSLDRAASAAVSNLRPIGDFVLAVDVQVNTPGRNGYALYLRQQEDGDRIALVIDADRRLATCYQRIDGRTSVLWDWSPVPALRDSTSPSRLTVRATGSRLVVWINGALLFDLATDAPRRGTLWLGALTWDQPTTVTFSNLRVVGPEVDLASSARPRATHNSET